MKITIFGAGYVGLTSALCFADLGHDVICMDTNHQRITELNQGNIPIYEPGMAELLAKLSSTRHISFTTDAAYAVQASELLFIAVGTPSQPDGSVNRAQINTVAQQIGKFIDQYKVIANKSTAPVGTARHIADIIHQEIQQRGLSFDIEVASNPEFLKEGSAIYDFMHPDRLIIGTSSKRAQQLLMEAHAKLQLNDEQILCMDINSAELTKYAANAMLATKISFINEMANLAELFDADINAVQRGIAADKRIGKYFLNPGCGYGGSCFPKDVRGMVAMAQAKDYEAPLIRAVEIVNYRQKRRLFEKITAHFQGALSNKTFALWGLAFKPNTDDIREAPSRTLMELLWESGAKVQAYDPAANANIAALYKDKPLDLMTTKEAALIQADALIICTEWPEFLQPDFTVLKTNLKQPIVFDGRNIYDRKKMQTYGIRYISIGRPAC